MGNTKRQHVASEWRGLTHHSKINLTIVVLLFAAIGTYMLLSSFAATPPNVTCTTTISPGADVVTEYGKLNAGQTLCLHGGNYTLYELRTTKNGAAGSPITIASYPGERATLTVNNLYTLSGQSYHSFLNINFVMSTTSNQAVMVQDFSDYSVYKGNDFSGIGKKTCMILGAVGYGTAHNTVIEDNTFHDCGNPANGNQDHAIYLSQVSGASINENIFWNTAAYAIHLYPSAQNNKITHNAFDSSGYGAVIFASDDQPTGLASNNNEFAYNLVTNNPRYGMHTYWGPGGVGTGNSAHDNCLYGNATNTDGLPSVTQSNNITANPLYINSSSHDYRMGSGSACLGVVGYDAAVAVASYLSGNATPPPALPSAPTGLVATAGDSQVVLNWSANPTSDNITHYNVYRSDQTYVWSQPTATTFTNASNVVNGTQYCYTISASNSSGEGPKTSQVCATPKAASTKTGDLNNDGVVNIFDLSILLSNYGKNASVGDLNTDGVVNIFDLSILLSNYGK